MRQSSGFTLIEMLIVLSAAFMLTFSSLFVFTPQRDFLQTHLFLSQFKSDLFYAQQYAISRQKNVTVYLLPDQYAYIVSAGEGGYLIERHYSREIKVTPATMSSIFRYLANGNIDKFGSIYIQAGKKTYRFTFQIGKGRFYVKQE